MDAILMFTRDRRNPNLKDQKELQPEDLRMFFNSAPNAKKGTNVYLVRAVMNMLLESDINGITDDQCMLSWDDNFWGWIYGHHKSFNL